MVIRISVFFADPSPRSPFPVGSSNALRMFQDSLHFLAVTSIALLCCLLLLCFCVRWRVLFMCDYVYVDVRYCMCLCVIAFMYVHVWMFICACVSKSYMWCVLHMWLFSLRGQDMTLLSVVMLFILPLFEGIFLMIKCPVVKLSLVCLRKKKQELQVPQFFGEW